MTALLLETRNLTTRLETDTGSIRPVNDVSLGLRAGETLAVVGESGSGKSMLAFSLMRLLPPAGRIERGSILWKGGDLLKMSNEEIRRVRGKHIALIFQETGAALNPVRAIGDQIAEPLRTHLSLTRRDARRRAVELLAEVRIPYPERTAKDYPHQLSGGMKQRVLIAMAIACDPELLIADEPTTALDATLQARILELLARLKTERNLSMLLITHDLGLVRRNADRVALMYAGRVVEEGSSTSILEDPRHPYTRGLWQSLPRPRGGAAGKAKLAAMAGMVPHLAALPPGCAFGPRCPVRFEPCDREVPSLESVGGSGDGHHRSACYREGAVLAAMGER
ncbi:MAG: ABC transporter ATP-binding protein, partial [Vicinamibacteria bacterium]